MEAHHASEPDRYMELLKQSHQLNGIRNRLRPPAVLTVIRTCLSPPNFTPMDWMDGT